MDRDDLGQEACVHLHGNLDAVLGDGRLVLLQAFVQARAPCTRVKAAGIKVDFVLRGPQIDNAAVAVDDHMVARRGIRQ